MKKFLFVIVCLIYSISVYADDNSGFSLVGNWYEVCSNPNPTYKNKIAIDHITFIFREDGTVTKTTNSDGEMEIEEGTYAFDENGKVFIVKLDKGKAGIQATHWKQEDDGKARVVYWKNLTLGYEDKRNILYVKEGSAEWGRREKISLNPGTTKSFIDPTSLQIGKSYRLSKDTPLMPELNPSDPIAAIGKIKKVLAGGIVKIISVTKKGNTPWYCVGFKNISTGEIETGWINSIALMGQSLEKVE